MGAGHQLNNVTIIMSRLSMHKIVDTGTTKNTLSDWSKVLVLLLDEAAVIVLVIVILQFFKVSIPLPATIIVALVLGGFIFVVHVAVVPSFHRKKVTGQEGMIGAQGRVVEPLMPVGTILVEGERWKAKSVDDSIETDEDVEIVGSEGLTLQVKRKDR